MKWKQLMTFILVFMLSAQTVIAANITTPSGKVVDVGDGKVHGPSSTYNPEDHAVDIEKKLNKHKKELTDARDEINKAKTKTRDKKKLKEYDKMLKKISREYNKVQDELLQEKDMDRKQPGRPARRGDAQDKWKTKERKKRAAAIKRLQDGWERRHRNDNANAGNATDLDDLGDYVVVDISDTHRDIMGDLDDLANTSRDFEVNNCDETNRDNEVVCQDIQTQYNSASYSYEQNNSKLKRLLTGLPAILLNAGGVFFVSQGLEAIQDLGKKLIDLYRAEGSCEDNCAQIGEQIEIVKEQIANTELEQRNEWFEVQDEVYEDEIGRTHVEVVVPKYLTDRTDLAFSNKDYLPLVFGVTPSQGEKEIKNIRVEVNGKDVPVKYYPKSNIVQSQFVGYKQKAEFEGKVIVEGVDGEIFEESFAGKMNLSEPKVQIKKKGGLLTRVKFQVSVKGEFDRIEISGSNVKPQVLSYDEVQTLKNFTVKTLSKGDASINVKASLTTKLARVRSQFNGPVREVELGMGRVLNPGADLFGQFNPTEKGQTGWCCETITKKTGKCGKCTHGFRTKGGCKAAAKKNPKIKYFLDFKSLKCEAL